MTDLAAFGLSEFEQRADKLRDAVGKGFDPRRAERNARTWLAIALAAGAEPNVPALRTDCIFPEGATALLRAWDIAPREECLAELERARDTLLNKHAGEITDATLAGRIRGLCTLANALGCAPYRPAPLTQELAA
ncbi:hypothetical protein ACRAQ6_14110 [Erythrobacter sp. HA6-11]